MPHSDFNIHDLLDPQGVEYPPGSGRRVRAYGASFWTQKTIAVGNSFEFGRSEQGKDETIVHEVLHLFYNGDHREIVKRLFGLEGVGEGDASAALDKFLESDCNPNPQ